jgi:hypothetical protein
MLYDPKWDIKTKPYSLAAFIGWLELQPKNGKYEFTDNHNCALAKWMRSMGGKPSKEPLLDSYHYVIAGKTVHLKQFAEIVADGEHTYGAALKRARAAL